jgi:hypothetical protein
MLGPQEDLGLASVFTDLLCYPSSSGIANTLPSVIDQITITTNGAEYLCNNNINERTSNTRVLCIHGNTK